MHDGISDYSSKRIVALGVEFFEVSICPAPYMVYYVTSGDMKYCCEYKIDRELGILFVGTEPCNVRVIRSIAPLLTLSALTPPFLSSDYNPTTVRCFLLIRPAYSQKSSYIYVHFWYYTDMYIYVHIYIIIYTYVTCCTFQ